MLKSDSEAAVFALKEKIVQQLGDGALEVDPAGHESERYGAFSSAVKVVKGSLRVYLMALDRKVAGRFPSARPAIAWPIEYVADTSTEHFKRAAALPTSGSSENGVMKGPSESVKYRS
jgi:hypothetical protein